MSTHYQNARISNNNCHVFNILKAAHAISSTPPFSCVESLPQGVYEHIVVVEYDTRKMRFFGEEINTCTTARLRWWEDSKGTCYYALEDIEDYGDEGYVHNQRYARCEDNLIMESLDRFDGYQFIS